MTFCEDYKVDGDACNGKDGCLDCEFTEVLKGTESDDEISEATAETTEANGHLVALKAANFGP